MAIDIKEILANGLLDLCHKKDLSQVTVKQHHCQYQPKDAVVQKCRKIEHSQQCLFDKHKAYHSFNRISSPDKICSSNASQRNKYVKFKILPRRKSYPVMFKDIRNTGIKREICIPIHRKSIIIIQICGKYGKKQHRQNACLQKIFSANVSFKKPVQHK